MENTIRLQTLLSVIHKTKAKEAAEKQTVKDDDLLPQVRDVKRQLAQAKIRFDLESDPEMLETHIYQIQSLEARLNYLLKRAKSTAYRCAWAEVTEKSRR